MKNKYIYFALIVAIVIALDFTGCATPPSTVGYPLIDIVDAEIDLGDDSQFIEDEIQWKRSSDTKIVGGTLGTKIIAKDLTIKLIDASIQIPIKEGEDVTDWFLNIPRGLKAIAHAENSDPENKAKYAADKGATEIIVTIEGIPEQTVNQAIKIRVPYEKTNRSWDFHVPPNPDIRFEVYGVDIAAVVVGGAVNREIDPKTFTIKFGGTRLADVIPQDTDISSWFTNLPRGLKAVVAEDAVPLTEELQTQSEPQQSPLAFLQPKRLKKGQEPTQPVKRAQQSMTVTISGTSSNQVNENMIVVIPADITVANLVLAIPPADKAKYDIGSYSKVSGTDIELRTGTNWKGAVSGQGLTGPEVFRLKDFTPTGIIQIEAESVYAIGEDGENHWTGDTVTYAKLMAEAKKLNAHAIIDVVIDSDDQVSKIIERRHVEANHEPTNLEKIKIQKKIINQEPDPDGGIIYVETIETIRRTSTGTALAIQYAPAYQPTVSEGATSGYVPAVPDGGR